VVDDPTTDFESMSTIRAVTDEDPMSMAR